MITIPVWSLLLTSILGGVVFLLLLMRGLSALLSGPLADSACPCCGRPADSAANQYRRYLEKMHENTAWLLAERTEIHDITLALMKAQSRHLLADVTAANDASDRGDG